MLKRAAVASTLMIAALTAGCGAGGKGQSSSPSSGRPQAHAPATDPVLTRLGLPPLSGHSPLPGYLMIADRDNNRIIIVNPAKQIVWRFPSSAPVKNFAGPDDAFVSADHRYIVTNEEFSDTVALLTLDSHPSIAWEYGHTDVQGAGPGYLAHPDDAYLLANGQLQIADIINCRILWLNRARQILRTLGTNGDCTHDPPRAMLQPNGDTPLPDGGVLVTEIGGWIDRFSAQGKLLWSIKSPTDYPSDAQLLGNGNVLVAGFNTPGRIDIIKPTYQVIWTYGPSSGPGSLDRPSLAVQLPNGMIAATDDWHHRVVLIDPQRKAIVWQYGHFGVTGSGPGFLSKPDGLDLIP